MANRAPESSKEHDRLIEEIVELEREFYFENKGKETERRRRLREIIERHTRTEKPRDVA